MRPTDPGIITIRQTCNMLHVKPWLMYRMLDTGVIGSYWTHDNRRLVDEYDVISYYASYEWRLMAANTNTWAKPAILLGLFGLVVAGMFALLPVSANGVDCGSALHPVYDAGACVTPRPACTGCLPGTYKTPAMTR